jgi:hypothetical protein
MFSRNHQHYHVCRKRHWHSRGWSHGDCRDHVWYSHARKSCVHTSGVISA